MPGKKIAKPVSHGVVKVPVIMQMEALECGAACLAMVLAYYDKWIPLEKVRLDCGVSRDGSNARNVMRAAKKYDLDVDAYRMEPDGLRENGTFPCIIHWNFNHFVVLDGFKGNHAYLNDPARGTVKVPMEVFDKSFTGVCMMFAPNEKFQPEGKKTSMLSYAAKRLKGAKAAVLFVILTTIISYLFGIISPAFTRFFMDHLLSGENVDLLYPFIGLFALIAFLQLLTNAVKTIYSLKINGKLAVIGSSTYMWKVLRLPMSFFGQRMAGDIQMRKNTNATIAETLINTLAPLGLNTFMLVFYLVIMIRYSVLLTLVGVASIAINAVMGRIISAKRVNITRVSQRDAGKLAAYTISGIQMVETIKSSGAENGFFEKWAGYQASVNTQDVRVARANAYLGIIPALVSVVAGDLVIVLGVYLTMQGKFTIGSITAFQGLLNNFMAPALLLVSAGQSLQEMRTQMERVEDVMSYSEDPTFSYGEGPESKGSSDPKEAGKETADEEDHTDYAKLRGNIELKNVTFGYSPLAEPLIRNFSMTMKPGSRVAFVGTSGCGKSTLANLISGLYQPWSGEILFDGRPISQIDRSVFTGSLAVVDQDIILFEDTIENNIKMWDNSIEDFEMILAARDAQIHDDIMKREGGYEGHLTEGGKDLSGGQRQRLEIARVLAQDPSIIIMDEATSALDARTEYDLVKAVKDRGITCIVIAHRLSTIRDSDEIIVLDHGNVVERGTHEELYAKGGYYTELISND